MELILVAIVIIVGTACFIKWQHRNDPIETPTQSQSSLYYSQNRNSYTEADEVFKILDEANIQPNFIGGRDE